jgi:hypothetical protein
MNDAPLPDPLRDLASNASASSSQAHRRVLDEIIDISADLIHMIHAEVRQAAEFTKPKADPAAPPPVWPPITQNAIGAFNDLARSIRLAVGLANTLDRTQPNASQKAAPTPPSHLPVLNDVVEVSLDLIRIIYAQVCESVAFTHRAADPSAPPVPLPVWPPITQDPIRAVNDLARSARLTVALAEKLEHPRKSKQTGIPEKQSPEEHHECHDSNPNEGIEAAECDVEAENTTALEDAIYRPIANIIANIGRTTGVEKFYDGHPWKQRFLNELPALIHQAVLQAAVPPATPLGTPPPDS